MALRMTRIAGERGAAYADVRPLEVGAALSLHAPSAMIVATLMAIEKEFMHVPARLRRQWASAVGVVVMSARIGRCGSLLAESPPTTTTR